MIGPHSLPQIHAVEGPCQQRSDLKSAVLTPFHQNVICAFRVAAELQDHRKLRQGAVQLNHGLAHCLDVAYAPELLRLANVTVYGA